MLARCALFVEHTVVSKAGRAMVGCQVNTVTAKDRKTYDTSVCMYV